jgi:hypothetical protein
MFIRERREGGDLPEERGVDARTYNGDLCFSLQNSFMMRAIYADLRRQRGEMS